MTERHSFKMRTLITSGENGFYRLILEGEGTIKELQETLTQLAVFPDSKKELWVISNLTLHLSRPEIVSLAELVKSNPHRPEMVAIVANNDLLFGLSRIFSGHREDLQTRIQVFRDEPHALDWLNASDISLPDAEEFDADDWQYFRFSGNSC